MNYLSLSWSTSKGRDTYGYNICRLDDRGTDKRYRCIGGGYDMVGTVFEQWMQDTQQDRLALLKTLSPTGTPPELIDCGYSQEGWTKRTDFYGLSFSPSGKISLDGATGLESMLKIAEAIGLSVTRDTGRRGTVGFFIS